MSDREIGPVLDRYFEGLHTGDVEVLRSVFHADAILWGEVRGVPYHKAVADYLDVVRDRESPRRRGEVFAMKVLAVDRIGAIALARVSCPMLGFDYVDLLSLLHRDGQWRIAAKVFTSR